MDLGKRMLFGGKAVELITETELLYGRNNRLKGRLSVTAEDVEEGYISNLWYDCDHVKVNGEKGRGAYCFVVISFKTKAYILTDEEWDDEVLEVLEWWLDGADNDLIDWQDDNALNNNWSDWDKIEKGVAYRGGSGYNYTLYGMKAIEDETN